MHITDQIRYMFLKTLAFFIYFIFYRYCILLFDLLCTVTHIQIFWFESKRITNQNQIYRYFTSPNQHHTHNSTVLYITNQYINAWYNGMKPWIMITMFYFYVLMLHFSPIIIPSQSTFDIVYASFKSLLWNNQGENFKHCTHRCMCSSITWCKIHF